MNSLEPADHHRVQAADGWLRLGDLAQAEAELAALAPAVQEHAEVLQLRWTLASRREDWRECLRLADGLVRQAPERRFGWLHLALSLHKLGRTAEAYDRLLAAADQFEASATLPFFLARFACALGRLDAGRHWLAVALADADRTGTGRELRRRAQDEPDLASIRDELADG
jgi:predicted Zn-dependent protease